MSRIEIIPPGLLFPDCLEDVIAWLRAWVADPTTRKKMIAEWCSYTGEPLTHEIAQEVLKE